MWETDREGRKGREEEGITLLKNAFGFQPVHPRPSAGGDVPSSHVRFWSGAYVTIRWSILHVGMGLSPERTRANSGADLQSYVGKQNSISAEVRISLNTYSIYTRVRISLNEYPGPLPGLLTHLMHPKAQCISLTPVLWIPILANPSKATDLRALGTLSLRLRCLRTGRSARNPGKQRRRYVSLRSQSPHNTSGSVLSGLQAFGNTLRKPLTRFHGWRPELALLG